MTQDLTHLDKKDGYVYGFCVFRVHSIHENASIAIEYLSSHISHTHEPMFSYTPTTVERCMWTISVQHTLSESFWHTTFKSVTIHFRPQSHKWGQCTWILHHFRASEDLLRNSKPKICKSYYLNIICNSEETKAISPVCCCCCGICGDILFYHILLCDCISMVPVSIMLELRAATLSSYIIHYHLWLFHHFGVNCAQFDVIFRGRYRYRIKWTTHLQGSLCHHIFHPTPQASAYSHLQCSCVWHPLAADRRWDRVHIRCESFGTLLPGEAAAGHSLFFSPSKSRCGLFRITQVRSRRSWNVADWRPKQTPPT